MKGRKTLAALLALVMAGTAFAAAGCSTDTGSAASTAASEAGSTAASAAQTENTAMPDKTVILTSTWIGYAPLHLAVEKGFFEQEGLPNVELSVIESSGDRNAAIKANQGQILTQTQDTEVMTMASGIDLKEVLPLCDSNGGDGLVCKNEYNSLEDLKGKTVALDTTGGASLYWFNTILEEAGMTMDDFDVRNMTAGDAGAAFVGGQVDAAVTWEPWLSNARKTDFGKVLYSSKDYPGVITDALAVRSDYAEQYPEAVKALIRGWFDAVAYAAENPDDANPIMAESMGMSTEDFEAQLQNIRYYDEDYANEYLCGGKMQENVQKASDLWVKMGLMDEGIDAGTLVDASYLEAIAGAGSTSSTAAESSAVSSAA